MRFHGSDKRLYDDEAYQEWRAFAIQNRTFTVESDFVAYTFYHPLVKVHGVGLSDFELRYFHASASTTYLQRASLVMYMLTEICVPAMCSYLEHNVNVPAAPHIFRNMETTETRAAGFFKEGTSCNVFASELEKKVIHDPIKEKTWVNNLMAMGADVEDDDGIFLLPYAGGGRYMGGMGGDDILDLDIFELTGEDEVETVRVAEQIIDLMRVGGGSKLGRYSCLSVFSALNSGIEESPANLDIGGFWDKRKLETRYDGRELSEKQRAMQFDGAFYLASLFDFGRNLCDPTDPTVPAENKSFNDMTAIRLRNTHCQQLSSWIWTDLKNKRYIESRSLRGEMGDNMFELQQSLISPEFEPIY